MLPLYRADCYHNYFAYDFENIDDEFGTMKDYIDLVKEVHRRGMKIYLDMETQYITDKHLWWNDAVGNLNSPYSDYILFQDEAHTKPATMIYDLTELNSYDGKKIKVTTVNLKSKKVLDYNVRLFSFFVDPNKDGKFDDGADGFRLDHAMDHLDNKPTLTNLFATFWSPLIKRTKQVNPKITFVAEQANWADYGFDYLEKAGADRVFAFGLAQAILSFNVREIINKADTTLGMTSAGKNQVIFIENHDLDRSASVLNNLAKEKAAAAIYLLIGGIPSIYYGQEIGMFGKGGFGIYGNTDGNDIPKREAFEWYETDSGPGMAVWYKNSGPWWDHTNLKPNDGISLEAEQKDPNSLYNFYKAMIKLRKSNLALSSGAYTTVGNDNYYVLSFLRGRGSDRVLVIVNLSAERQHANIRLKSAGSSRLYGNTEFRRNLDLDPYSVSVWAIR
jgi:glycosidase